MRTHGKPPVNIISSQEKLRAQIHRDFPDLEKLKRSEKRIFLEKHREAILGYLEIFGEKQTRLQFHMKKETLWQLQEGYATNPYRKMTKREETEIRYQIAIEKVEQLEKRIDYMQIRLENIPELRKEIRETKEAFESFSQSTANSVVKALLQPLLESLLKQYGGEFKESEALGVAVKAIDIPQNKRCLKGATRWSQGY